MKQVGEAVRDFILSCSHKEGDIVTIGIATWGTVYNRESLVCPMVSQAGQDRQCFASAWAARGVLPRTAVGTGASRCHCGWQPWKTQLYQK